ncbi:MAG: hypothetical protein EA397_01315 [Deltaproteobacteria bacterium]|nr:MAG: hypothetical protein EA397_01315 [Deltaproteobacteria bacterium]
MSDREERRRRRATMPIRRFALGDEPDDLLVDSTSIDERLAMMWPLAKAAFEAAGIPTDPPPRHLLPGRVLRRPVEP